METGHTIHNSGFLAGEVHFENLFQFSVEILKHSLVITAFVMVMMLLIEYLTVQTRGQWSRSFERHPLMQVLLAALLGLTPGCLGGFFIVTLYTHRIINMAALATAMIASSGDEAFIMIAMIPDRVVLLIVVLFIIAVITGLAP